jgi:hypothetical protein
MRMSGSSNSYPKSAVSGVEIMRLVHRAMRHFRLTVLGILITAICLCAVPGEALTESRKIALLFNLDQGFPAGIVETNDLNGLDRILAVLEEIKGKYDVYAIFSPLTAKTNNLHAALRSAAVHRLPFFLDVYTSDAMTIGNILIPANPQADPSHALTLSLDGLRALKADKEIGPYFAGIRIFEVMAEDFTVKTCLAQKGEKRVDWCDHFQRNVATADVFTRDTAKEVLDFAKGNGMLVFWSDWKWDSQTEVQQKTIVDLLSGGDYRDTVILAYANNLPNEVSRNNDSDWQRWVAKYSPMVGKSVRGIALSDQAWLCDTDIACPLPAVQNWAERAIKAGAMAIQFEPANYFFELAKGTNRVGYPNSPQWREVSGRPSEQLVLLASSLGVDLTRREPTPLSRIQNDRTICMALDIDQPPVVEGQTFKASATFRNAGTNAWEPNRVSLFSYSEDVWRIGSISLPVARIEPGHNVKVSFTATAPSKPVRQRLDVGLRSKEGTRFEDFCSISVSVESKK